MKFYYYHFNPSTLPAANVGVPYSQDINLLPFQGGLISAEIVGDGNGLSASVVDANNLILNISGTPINAGDIPITVKIVGTLGEGQITY